MFQRLAVALACLAVIAASVDGRAVAAGPPIASTRFHPVPSLSRVIVLAGSIPPTVRHARKGASLNPQKQVAVAVHLKLRNGAELSRLLHDLYDPRSQQYGRFLSPAQFAARYAPAADERRQVADWLELHGLHLVGRSGNGTQLTFRGTASRVQRAFGTSLFWYRHGARTFYANAEPVKLPSTVASSVLAVSGLTNAGASLHTQFRPRTASAAHPFLGYSPQDIAGLYGFGDLQSSGTTGSTQTIALVSHADYSDANIRTFDSEFGLTSQVERIKVDDGFNVGADLGDGQDEAESDVEIVQGVAPRAHILVYEADNSDVGAISLYNRIVGDGKAQVISTSWGAYEGAFPSTDIKALHQALQQAAAQGQSFFAASGDAGAYDEVQADGSGDPTTLAVDYPASDPWVTGVGGTTLHSSGAAYASESAWSNTDDASHHVGSGGGLSDLWQRPDYQSGPGVANSYSNGKRQVPDVAANADDNTGYAVYTVDQSNNYRPTWGVLGGTSAAAPLWAAFTALANQRLGRRLGFLNPTLYTLGQRAATLPQPPFHDVTGGTNLFYSAGAGWDYATGWGSFNGRALIDDISLIGGDQPPPTATSTPTRVTHTPTPTPTRPADQFMAIDRVMILRGSSKQETRSLTVQEKAAFVVLYHTLDLGGARPTGRLVLTRHGHTVKTYTLSHIGYKGHAALGATVKLLRSITPGAYVAHFKLSLGPLAVKRDRKFSVTGV